MAGRWHLRQRVLLGRARSFSYLTIPMTMPSMVWPHSSKNTLTLLAALESDSVVVEEEKSVTIVEHAFVAASGNGVIIESR
ncbi:hypothetical protein BGW80DRAFT_1566697 [Lactifluus volemus]|nr:hypothetical protein BGW80DRAFT_1566697 [Lactifluus volemus]